MRAATYPFYQIDAFTDSLFGGNPAAVAVLDHWLPDSTLLAIAAENNLSETAFVLIAEPAHPLRWFTPKIEVDLCGHATLACAYVLFAHGYVNGDAVQFDTRSGPLRVTRDGGSLAMDFPARPPEPVAIDADVAAAIGARPGAALAARDLVFVYENEAAVRDLQPDFDRLAQLEPFAVCVTAPGDSCDFVSRFFAPAAGIAEDPVTGSAHCTLVPYWAERLGKRELLARQISRRGGELRCEHHGERVLIAGRATQYLQGTISIPEGR